MLRKRCVPVLFLIVLFAAGPRAQQQFTLLASLVDPQSGKSPETIAPADIRVTEDGADAKVVKVDSVVRTLKVQVLVDNGVGIGQNLTEVRNGVRGLLEALPPDVETTLVTTAPQPRFLVKATKSHEELLKGVDRLTLDSGAGRFTDSLSEAAERANKDKDAFTILIAAGTLSGDTDVREAQLNRLVEQLRGKPITVHVLMFSGEKSATGGGTPQEVGQAVTKMTGGRYEYINTISRYATLLPEFAAEVKKQGSGSTRMFRISVQRPDGKKGPLGKISVSTGGLAVTSVKME